MIKTAKKIFAAVMAMTVAAVLSVCANAALLETPTVEGSFIGGVNADGSMTVVVDIVSGNGKDKSVNYVLKGDALQREFWNRSDAYVEVDLTLETDTDTVTAIIPAFAKGWSWVDPSVWGTALEYGKTITIREPLSTYYTEFKNKDPMLIRVQFTSSSPEMETVQISLSGIRFVGVEDNSAEDTTTTTTTTTTIATTTLPEESEDVADDPVESVETAEQPGTEENSESEPAVTTASSASDNNDKDSGTQTEATSSVNDGTKATSTRAPANIQSDDTSIVGVIVVIVIVAVVVVAGAVVGYIIYRKKKYY